MPHAILINEENLPEIIQTVPLVDLEENVALELFIRAHTDYYLVTGVFHQIDRELNWIVLPQIVLDRYYEYDPVKIRTDWDQIVKLQRPEQGRLPYKDE